MSEEPVETAAAVAVSEPDDLTCPITHVLFRDPAFVVDSGNTYERSAIETHWWLRGRPHDPLSNLDLSYGAALYTNWDKRRGILRFLAEHPGYLPEGWDSRALPAPRRTPHRVLRLCRSCSSGLSLLWRTAGCSMLFGMVLGLMMPAATNYWVERRSDLLLAEAGGSVEGLVRLMRDYPGHACVQEGAILALTHAAVEGVDERAAIIEADGASQIIAAMRTTAWAHDHFFPHAQCAGVVKAVSTQLLGSLLFSEQAQAVIRVNAVAEIIATLNSSAPLARHDLAACYAMEAACWSLTKLELLRNSEIAQTARDPAKMFCSPATPCDRQGRSYFSALRRWLASFSQSAEL